MRGRLESQANQSPIQRRRRTNPVSRHRANGHNPNPASRRVTRRASEGRDNNQVNNRLLSKPDSSQVNLDNKASSAVSSQADNLVSRSRVNRNNNKLSRNQVTERVTTRNRVNRRVRVQPIHLANNRDSNKPPRRSRARIL